MRTLADAVSSRYAEPVTSPPAAPRTVIFTLSDTTPAPRQGTVDFSPRARTRTEYERLTPNLEEYVGTDCDAFTSMDPQAAALYFATRGWDVLSHPTFRDRMLARHSPVVVRKPTGR